MIKHRLILGLAILALVFTPALAQSSTTTLIGQSIHQADTDNGMAPSYRVEFDRPFAQGRFTLNVEANSVNGGNGSDEEQTQNVLGGNLLVNFFPQAMIRLALGGGFSSVWQDDKPVTDFEQDTEGSFIPIENGTKTAQFLRWQTKARAKFCFSQTCDFALVAQVTYNDAVDKDNSTRALESAVGLTIPMPR